MPAAELVELLLSAHRADARHDQRLHHRRRRRRARRGSGHRRAPGPRRGARSPRRDADRDQGQHRRRRAARDARLRVLRRPRPRRGRRGHRAGCAAAGAIVLGKVTLHEFAYGATTDNDALRHLPQPLGPRARARRVERRIGRRAGRRPVRGRAGHRHRRIGADPRGAQRRQRAAPDLRASSAPAGRSRSARRWTRSARWRAPSRTSPQLFAVMAGYDRDDPHAVEHPFRDPLSGAARRASPGCGSACRAASSSRIVDRASSGRRTPPPRCCAGLGPSVVDVDLDGARGRHGDRHAADPRRGHRPAPRAPRRRGPERFGADVRRRLRLGDEVERPGLSAAPWQRMRDWRVPDAAGLRRRGPAADADHERDGAAARRRGHDRHDRPAHAVHVRAGAWRICRRPRSRRASTTGAADRASSWRRRPRGRDGAARRPRVPAGDGLAPPPAGGVA